MSAADDSFAKTAVRETCEGAWVLQKNKIVIVAVERGIYVGRHIVGTYYSLSFCWRGSDQTKVKRGTDNET